MPKDKIFPRRVYLLGKDGNYYSVLVKPNKRYGSLMGRDLIALYSKKRRRHNLETRDPKQMLLA